MDELAVVPLYRIEPAAVHLHRINVIGEGHRRRGPPRTSTIELAPLERATSRACDAAAMAYF
jgi:hypothetical protein